MSSRPVIPELFVGEKSWYECIDHFESVVEVCDWDNTNMIKWLCMHLASTIFRCLPDAVKADYSRTKDVLRARFEPETQRTLYRMRLQTQVRRKGEGWAKFGED